jgi:hypothetical protein
MFKVLFYETASQNEIVLDFVRQLSAEEKKVVGEDLKTVQIGFPMGLPLCRPLGDGLYEIRSSLPSKREFRLIFFFDRARQPSGGPCALQEEREAAEKRSGSGQEAKGGIPISGA